ncbi:DUF3678 domain-containing protein [Thioclava sp. BHET1]|nr:DUF3678 domain-containing protein [Thioclava sp. BHET1]
MERATCSRRASIASDIRASLASNPTIFWSSSSMMISLQYDRYFRHFNENIQQICSSAR